jgi:hypothetical protein
MYAGEYMPPSSAGGRHPLPLTLNALGASAGFAAQVAVWRGLVLSRRLSGICASKIKRHSFLWRSDLACHF